MLSIQSVFQSAINHNLDGCFYSSIWNWDMVGGYMRRVWIPVFRCLALAQDTLKIQSRFGTMTLWPGVVIDTLQRSLSCSAVQRLPCSWLPPVCRQLHSSDICKQLCHSRCNCSLEDPWCWGILQSCEATAASPQCARAWLQRFFFIVIVSPWLWFGHCRGAADTAQHSSGSRPRGSARLWTELNSWFLTGEYCPLRASVEPIQLHVTLLWQIAGAFTSLCSHLRSSLSSNNYWQV